MAKAGGSTVTQMSDKTFFHDMEVTAQKAIKEDVEQAIRIFSAAEYAD